MLHVSDLLFYRRCERYAWNMYHHILQGQRFCHMVMPFSTYWKEYYDLENVPEGQVGDSNEQTLEKLKVNDVMLNARFSYRECRTRIPILFKIEGGYRAVYPFLSCFPKENEALRMRLNAMIARSAGIEIIDNRILYLNKDYERGTALDVKQVLLETSRFFNRNNNPGKEIQPVVDSLYPDIDSMIDVTAASMTDDKQPIGRSKACTSGRRCMFYTDCFDDSLLPDDSVLFLTTSRNKIEAHNRGIRTVSQLPIEEIEGFRLQYAQFKASQKNPFIDKIALEHWMKKIAYPVSYLDFEWDTFGIPPYEGMKVFDVLCFQYSLHIEESPGHLIHKDYFGTGDCRRAFVESLLADLPESGTILVYNMEGAEKLRLLQLAHQFPEYKDKLEAVCARMVDLSKPFETGVFYDNRMRGHYSLKNLLPIFTDEVSYQQLQIHDGQDAVHVYRTFEMADAAAQKQIREAIRTYCRMDTYAEYIVYHGLIKLLEE